MRDVIARLSEAVARDPAGMAWVALADALRRARQLEAAQRVAQRGLERHPYAADGHDVLARIAADGGDLGVARDEWEMAVRVDPRHVGARLGLSWLALRGGDVAGARRWWQAARQSAPDDPRVAAAGRRLEEAAADDTPEACDALEARAARSTDAAGEAGDAGESGPLAAPAPRAGPTLQLLTPGAHLALVVDADGLVLARAAGPGASAGPGTAPGARDTDGGATDADDAGVRDTEALAAELSGLTREAQVALAELQLGGWERLHVECDARQLALAPLAQDGVALVVTAADAPVGLSRLLVERTRRRADAWLEAL